MHVPSSILCRAREINAPAAPNTTNKTTPLAITTEKEGFWITRNKVKGQKVKFAHA